MIFLLCQCRFQVQLFCNLYLHFFYVVFYFYTYWCINKMINLGFRDQQVWQQKEDRTVQYLCSKRLLILIFPITIHVCHLFRIQQLFILWHKLDSQSLCRILEGLHLEHMEVITIILIIIINFYLAVNYAWKNSDGNIN